MSFLVELWHTATSHVIHQMNINVTNKCDNERFDDYIQHPLRYGEKIMGEITPQTGKKMEF